MRKKTVRKKTVRKKTARKKTTRKVTARKAAVGRLSIREIRKEDDPLFEAAFRLLRNIFPSAEMLPRADWLQVMRERAAGLWTDMGWHLLVAERGGRAVGAASGSYIGSINVGLVGYVAVVKGLRSAGIGPRLRARLRAAFERDANRVHDRHLSAIIGEVQENNPWLRRLVTHYGAIALDFEYYQPSLPGGGEPVPLVMYYEPIGRVRRTLPAEEVRRLLYTMWRRSYRIPRPLSKPSFRRMIGSIGRRKSIGQRTLPPPSRRD